MASLKEIKSRIGSVQGTRKVTSAMKMVSSAKLHKAQSLISAMLPYQRSLDSIVSNFLSGETPFSSPYILSEGQTPDLSGRAVIIVFSSNSSLCGAFNYNVIREFASLALALKKEGVPESMIDVYDIVKFLDHHRSVLTKEPKNKDFKLGKQKRYI